MPEIDRDSPVPPYQQVAGFLRAQIASGTLGPGARLPSIEGLMQEYGIARTTARKARQIILDEGLAANTPGWGTFVVDPAERPR
jgi:DNA-binding GntR family transcriptional regulator